MELPPWLGWLRSKPVPLGLRGERYAARWLRWRGYRIVAGGKRTRYGEIDLVAVHRRTVVFIEVKTRSTTAFGHPAEAVGPDKQRRIVRSALSFLKEHRLLENASRFDVVCLVWPSGARRPQVEHFRNAFEPAGQGQMFS